MNERKSDLISREEIERLLVVAQDQDDISLDECNKFLALLGFVPSVSTDKQTMEWESIIEKIINIESELLDLKEFCGAKMIGGK